jgi:hypothetical protein
MQDLRQGDQERGMRWLQQAIRKMHLPEEIKEACSLFNAVKSLRPDLVQVDLSLRRGLTYVPGRRAG